MQATIEIESLKQDWKPPFAKRREVKSVIVKEGDFFETLRDGTPLFTVHTIHQDRMLLQYSRMYTLKGYEHPTERKLWLGIHDPKKFSSLWDDNGITLTLTLRDVKGNSEDSVSIPEAASESTVSPEGSSAVSNEHSELYLPVSR